MCGAANKAEMELLRLWNLVNVDKQVDHLPTLQKSVQSKFYGWDALQGYLSPDGHVVAFCLDDNTTQDSLYAPRQVYSTALDVASCGPSTDYCTVVVGQTGELYYWTLTDPLPRALLQPSLPTDGQDLPSKNKSNFTRVWAGEAHFLALDQEGTLFSWGSGRHGQLGNGDLVSKISPEPVEPLEGIRIVDAACGASFSVALSETGDVYTFGLNDHGQLGIGKAERNQEEEKCNTALPQVVDFYEHISHSQQGGFTQIEVNVVQVACGHSHTVVLDDRGRVWSCGWGKYGQLGQDESLQLQHGASPGRGGEDGIESGIKQKLLRLKGCLAMENDCYYFGQSAKENEETGMTGVGSKLQRWLGVCCGRWSTLVWSQGDKTKAGK
ncbi:hypothetical protein EC991_005103 [Linnemannia zychae]|nr:hypothetical protein EC991_005103 [Linnemannia zychae]